MTARLRLSNITKAYPGIVANDSISLEVNPGEVLAILGENGAGKSTLMKIIYGATSPDAGSIEYDGKPVEISNPAVARELGIAMVHQHFALFETLSVAQNVVLGLAEKLSIAEAEEKISVLGERYGLPIDPKAVVADLTMGERQRVEIIRALMTSPSLLILDEPTSVLTPQAVRVLFKTLKKLSSEGVSILFISHKLDEIRELANRCTILRMGKVVQTVDPKVETEESLARLMIGAEPPVLNTEKSAVGKVLFEIKGLTRNIDETTADVADINLSVHAGEIVGIAGISGNGQSRLFGLLAGELVPSKGEVRIDGEDITFASASDRRRMGLRYVPEERLGHGSVPEMSLLSNILLTGDKFRRSGFVSRTSLKKFAEDVVGKFRVKTHTVEKAAGALSGGNLQKFIVGREIMQSPKVLLIDQPTWGVDVGAATLIRNQLLALKKTGAAIIVVSEEIDELYEVSDRIAVMCRGRMSPAVPKESLSTEELGRWMGGLWAGSPFKQQ